MGMDQATLSGDLLSILAPLGLGLHDVELTKGLVRVTVTRPDGVTLEDLTSANHTISAFLDEHEPMNGRYTLEVSSPGVERKLRTPEHFSGAIGEQVAVKATPGALPERRVEGTLSAVDDQTITIAAKGGEEISLSFAQIDRARTVFPWGPQSKPSPSRAGATKSTAANAPSVPERMKTS